MNNEFDGGESPIHDDDSEYDDDEVKPRFYGVNACIIAAVEAVINNQISFYSARNFWVKVSMQLVESTRIDRIGMHMARLT